MKIVNLQLYLMLVKNDNIVNILKNVEKYLEDNMSNIECPSFKLDCNGDCKYYGVDYDEDTGSLVHYCICDGVQLKFKDCCEMYVE